MRKIVLSKKEIIREFCNLVRIPSDSGDCQAVADHISKTFRTLGGWKIREQKFGPGELNLIITPRKNKGAHPLLFAAHMDTVQPGRGIVPVVKNGRIIPASQTILGADNKSAIAVFLHGVRLAQKRKIPLAPIEFVFTYGEEQGLQGAKNLDTKAVRSRRGICFDSDGNVGTITVSAPTYMKYTLTIHGKAAHSGIEPEKGISAIKTLSEIISLLPNGRIDKETTTNIGLISGGRALNIIPEKAQAEGEVRSLYPSKIRATLENIKQTARRICRQHGTAFSFSVAEEFHGFLIPKNDPFLREISGHLKSMGCKVQLNRSNGGSDANIFNRKGIRTLNMAIGMQNAHTTKEFITVDNLVKAVGLFLKIASQEEIEVVYS
jgi:tripeptide aminopeptidase